MTKLPIYPTSVLEKLKPVNLQPNLYEQMAHNHRRSSTLPIKAKSTCTKPLRRLRKEHSTKKVSFAPTLTYQLRSITDDELKKAWYSSEDYNRFEQDRRDTIRVVQQQTSDSSKLDPTQYTTRGLEQSLTREQAIQRKYENLRYVNTILERQYLQRKLGLRMVTLPHAYSQYYAHEAGRRAYMQAVLDEALNL